MWKWLNELFGVHEEQVHVDEPAPDDELEVMDDGPYRTPAEVIASAPRQIPKAREPGLIDIIKDAAQEVADERVKVERDLFTNDKVRTYFQKSIKYVMTQLDGDSYNFVLVHANNAGIPDKGFQLFAQVFSKACNELGISTEINATYVRVDKPGVRKLLDKIPTSTPRVDINEKVRVMLGR
jgi:hypothetical protein